VPLSTSFHHQIYLAGTDVNIISSKSESVGFISPSLTLARRPKTSKGVIATAPIKKNTIVELAPAILVPASSMWLIDTTMYRDAPMSPLGDYLYPSLIPGYNLNVLGWGMMYNHCEKGTASFNLGWESVRDESLTEFDVNLNTAFSVRFWTERDIEVGEELCWSYWRCVLGG